MRRTRGLLSLVSSCTYTSSLCLALVLNDGGTIKLKIEGGPGPGFSRHLFSKSKTEWGDMGDWSGELGADTDNMKRVILQGWKVDSTTDHVHPPMVFSVQERPASEGAQHEQRGLCAPPRSNRGAGVDGIVLCMCLQLIISQVSIFGLSVRAQRYSTELAYTTTCNSDE
ncbi:hypothetical protein NCU07867 [Neurospora crassa OR74A]|uniref:Uncharacterized protein n=1 Tax=Neurospora crassa (strain ATCC 24698 / 74-OR23-1A / CBS 708.71 / DSM 1257 / FGSC 987) TaxID=367110 RepID=Q7SBU2_NEUCR|nr:hypothetical protein NCU07867 [Neurospora crassa OR74A]EAA33892.3 hypothetical protein NCU07867 [Neurospora crassa OR74A]|eukprot:XP_963128.3 hypothetical protein NCU07867 [Neurospora crassa OR74A]